jgi:L-ascorbate metabolism protein UlaG (beta-lactamase superfamily)
MEITYFGHSCFRIKTKTTTVVTDPFDPGMVGFNYPKLEADIVTISHHHRDHDFLERILGSPFVIDGPGEYEVKGVSIFGFKSFHDGRQGAERGENTFYSLEAEGLRVCHLGDLGEKLSSPALEDAGEIDILLFPIGGVFTLGPKEETEILTAVAPAIAIPMHFRAPGINLANFGQLATLEEFTKEVGEVKVLPKLIIAKDKLPEEREIVVLERKNIV